MGILYFYFFKKISFIYFWQSRREEEREGEKHQRVVASRVPCTREPGPQPRHVPQLGIKRATLWFTASVQSTEPHQPGLNNSDFFKGVVSTSSEFKFAIV